jgi:hypothetical protein
MSPGGGSRAASTVLLDSRNALLLKWYCCRSNVLHCQSGSRGICNHARDSFTERFVKLFDLFDGEIALDLDANTPQKSAEDMRGFETKTNFVTRFLNMFLMLISGSLKVEAASPWNVLCSQTVTYPPPNNHPLLHQQQAQ